MTTALIVIGSILLFFVILFTAHAFITIELKDDFYLTVRFLGIPIHILPSKPKKYKLKDYTLKKIRKREAAAAKKEAKKAAAKKKKQEAKEKKKAEQEAADAALTPAERKAKKAAEKAKKPKLTDLIPLVARVAKLFFSRFFGKLHIKVARIHIKVAAGDAMTAAVLYGTVNQSVQYLMEVLGKICHVDGLKKADIDIRPDFLASSLEFDCKLTFRVSLGNILGAAIKAGFSFLVGYVRIKPHPDESGHKVGDKKPESPKAPDCAS